MIIYLQFRKEGQPFEEALKKLKATLPIREVKTGALDGLDILQIKVEWNGSYQELFKEATRCAGEVHAWIMAD